MQASSATFATAPLTATHAFHARGSTALAAYATYKAAVLLTHQSRWQPTNGQATKFPLNIVNRATHTMGAIVDPVDSFLRGSAAYFLLLKHTLQIGPVVNIRMLFAAAYHLKHGWHTAFGMFGIAAADNGKAKEAADLAAELVHMGWGGLVAKVCVSCMDLGYEHQVIQIAAVLTRQRDWDVLKATGRFLNSMGAKEQAVILRTALAVHGIEDLIGAVGHQPVSKTVAQAAHEVKSAGDKTAHTAGALSSAVLDTADSVLPGKSHRHHRQHTGPGVSPSHPAAEACSQCLDSCRVAVDRAMYQADDAMTGKRKPTRPAPGHPLSPPSPTHPPAKATSVSCLPHRQRGSWTHTINVNRDSFCIILGHIKASKSPACGARHGHPCGECCSIS